MSKTMPQHSPMHYLRLEQASYSSDSRGFLARHAPGSEFLEEGNVNGWKFILIKEKASGELSVAFKGTEPEAKKSPGAFLSNWWGNIWHQLTPHDRIAKLYDEDSKPNFLGRVISVFGGQIARKIFASYEEVLKTRKIISDWEKKYGTISVLVAHSGGCVAATHLGGGKTVISFNGHKAERGFYNINLALSGDPLTGSKLTSVPSRYIVLDQEKHGPARLEDHSLDAFEPYLKGKTWKDLSSKFTDQASSFPPLLERRDPGLSHLEAELEKQAVRSLELLQTPPSEQASLDVPFDVIEATVQRSKASLEQLEITTKSAEQMQGQVEGHWKRAAKSENLEGVLSCVDQIAFALYRDQQEMTTQRQKRLYEEAVENEFERKVEQLRQRGEFSYSNFSLPQMHQVVLSAIHPKGSAAGYCDKLRQFTESYQKTQSSLQKLLTERKQRQNELGKAKAGAEKLDSEIRQHYQALLSEQRKISKLLRKTTTALRIASAVLTVVPGGQAIAIASHAIRTASTVAEIGKGVFNKKREKLEHAYQAQRRENLDVLGRLAWDLETNAQETSVIIGAQAQHRSLLASPDSFEPTAYRRALHEAGQTVEEQIQEKRAAIGLIEGELTKNQTEIDRLREIKRQQASAIISAADKKARERREGRLQNTKKDLLARKENAARLGQQLSAIQSELDRLTEENSQLKKLQRREGELAPIKDYFHEALQEAATRNEALDEQTRKWREEVDKGIAHLDSTYLKERAAVDLTASALRDCLQFSSRAQLAVDIAGQSYLLFDVYRRWEIAHKVLDKTLEDLRKTNPDATMQDAINKMGDLFYFAQCFVPTFQMVGIAFGILRAGYYLFRSSPETVPPEKILFDKLSECLRVLGKEVEGHFQLLNESVEHKHVELVKLLNFVRTDIVGLNQQITHEMHACRDEIIDQLQVDSYHAHIARIKEKGMQIRKAGAMLEDTLEACDPQERSMLLHRFIEGIYQDLILETKSDVNRLVNTRRGPEGFEIEESMISMKLAARNPDLACGALAATLGMQRPVPSLYLLLHDLENYLMAQKLARKYGIELQGNEIESLLMKQIDDILVLASSLEVVVDRARTQQEALIDRLQRKMTYIEQIRKNALSDRLKRFIESSLNILEDLASEERLTGVKKFGYAEAFLKQSMGSSYTHQFDPSLIKGIGKTVLAAPAGALGAAVPVFFPMGAIAAVFGFSVAPIVAGAAIVGAVAHPLIRIHACYQLRKVGEDDTQLPFKSKVFVDLTSKQDVIASPDHTIEIQIWINKSGRLASQVRLFTLSNDICFKPNVSLSAKETIAEKTPFIATLVTTRKGMETKTEGEISLEEIQKLDPALHLAAPEYAKQLLRLSKEYAAYLKEPAAVAKENVFAQLKDPIIITSKNPSLIPLAFPSVLLDALYGALRIELNQMQVLGVGTLVPYYDLEESEQGVMLKLGFNFLNAEQNLPYAEFTIATIDQETVSMFACPTFKVDQKPNAANLNEMLLQLLYTSLLPALGVPSAQSVKLGKGKWTAPAERSFPGFFSLWEKEPAQNIHFKMRQYTQQAQNEAEEVASGIRTEGGIFGTLLQQREPPSLDPNYVRVSQWAQGAKKELDSVKQALQNNYDALWAFCCFRSALDDATLRFEIEQKLGILDPTHFDRLMDQISFGARPEPISDGGIHRFETLLAQVPSRSLAKLQELIFNSRSQMVDA